MHTQVLAVAGAGLVALAVAPGLAQAQDASRRPADSSSADQRALTAYDVYLTTLSADAHLAAARDTLLVDGVVNTCPGALSDLGDLSASQLKQSALTDFADEVDADLDLAYMGSTRPALVTFAAALTELHWSTGSQTQTTVRLMSTERSLLHDPESDICADATTLDAAPLNEPTATATFLRRYRARSGAVRSALIGFQALLAQFETNTEHKLVAQINTLVAQFSAQSDATEQSDGSTILADLGISQSP